MRLVLFFLMCWQASACILVVKAFSVTHSDPDKDRRGCYKRGMIVAVVPDNYNFGTDEKLPRFVHIKIPGVPVASAEKYIAHQIVDNAVYRRRLWQIRWADLPAGAQTKLRDNGELTIKVGAYAGTYDYTWDQVKGYFRNLDTNQDETENL